MRVTLAALAPVHQRSSRSFDVPVTVRIRSARGSAPERSFQTDSYSLSRMLRRKTELPSLAIDGFMAQLKLGSSANLQAIELKDDALQAFGVVAS